MIKLNLTDVSIGHPASGIRHPASSIQLNTGSPHVVIFVDNIQAMDVVSEGRKIRQDTQLAPDGTNVDFVEVMEDKLFVRTYERGVEDETLSCGTGVTAAALAYASEHSVVDSPQSVVIRNPESGIFVETLGGTLTVSFRQHEGNFTDIWLKGPAEFVFRGELNL